MVATLSEMAYGFNQIIPPAQRCGDGRESDAHHLRGKTTLNQITEAIGRSLFSVIMLEDNDEANILLRLSI
ncbi:hypothetical protein AAZX31_07G193900 [Glycine max]|uniref:Uncharacterized protein n=2 Tax=Glycine subgen. Soja TaxID=1462606 RepID=K7L2Z0_SOYBN|nr:hypothetical protein JHK87_019261 [Glycine soja]KAG5023486.1 hypothetical protein JHK85_019828 [Glycine max]KAG5038562.1 hypothetical protein JHK86_019402 [Glycine max]KAG5143691.1 hypothetical protein JHK82_019386 [Glycine max]KAH1087867.1 hypothetical protein GYH30_019102 [Glycine max]